MAADPRLTADALLQKLRSGEIRSTEISRYAWRLEEEELTKFMDLLLPWMNAASGMLTIAATHHSHPVCAPGGNKRSNHVLCCMPGAGSGIVNRACQCIFSHGQGHFRVIT